MEDYCDVLKDHSRLVMVDIENNQVLFDENSKPSSKFSAYVFANAEKLHDRHLAVYGSQIGTVVANLTKIVPIVKIVAGSLSKPGKKVLDRLKITYKYDRLVDLVESSSNPGKVCPIERSLVGLDTGEAISNLSRRFGK